MAAVGSGSPPNVRAQTSQISQADLRRHVSYLASDELGGRYAFGPSNALVERYLAEELKSYGFRGAAPDGSFLQRVPVERSTIDAGLSELALVADGRSDRFTIESDYMLETPALISPDVSVDLVFLGYGISSPRHRHDDYAGLDVRGKYVVTVKGQPASLEGVQLDASEQRAAVAHGAIGEVVISQGLLSGYEHFSSGYARRRFYRIAQTPVIDPPPQIVQAGPALVAAIASAIGVPESVLTSPDGKEFQPRPLGRLEIHTRMISERMPETHNVLAVLDGADADSRDEFVGFAAHHDHLQTQGDAVFNGADDNASGVATVLEVARALAEGARPRRSVLIMLFTAEEQGLLGSRYLARYEPVVPMENLLAVLNADMVGRSRASAPDVADPDPETADSNTVYVGLDGRRYGELRDIIQRTSEGRLRLDYRHGPQTSVYRRSDHYTFAMQGIPAIWYFTGFHAQYHTAHDDVAALDFDKMRRIAGVILASGREILDLDHRLDR